MKIIFRAWVAEMMRTNAQLELKHRNGEWHLIVSSPTYWQRYVNSSLKQALTAAFKDWNRVNG